MTGVYLDGSKLRTLNWKNEQRVELFIDPYVIEAKGKMSNNGGTCLVDICGQGRNISEGFSVPRSTYRLINLTTLRQY
jgi:hypothetical protein